MPLTVTNAATTAPDKTSAAAKGLAGDFEGFLKLLTTQLQQQDPLSPMDSDKFTSQLVQFSTVEQAIRTNDQLGKLIGVIETSQATAALGYLGAEVRIEGDGFSLGAEGDVPLGYELPEAANSLGVEILDEAGRTVRLLEGPADAGRHTLAWDGRDAAGNRLPPGAYRLRVSALDAGGVPLAAKTEVNGLVEAIEQEGGAVFLVVGGVPRPMDVVHGIRRAPASAA
ncbi:MAG: flagellar hook assembly protein FlgD [Geminicoccaceae bacterium]|nr:flagellar hook assembly protein FlgD [Geminicoccaceae bacterium]